MAGRKPRKPWDEEGDRPPLRGVPAVPADEAEGASESPGRVRPGGRRKPADAPKAGSGIDPDTGEWSPAYPGQRPPFRPGHTISQTHGAYNEALIGPARDAILRRMLTDPDMPDHLRHPMWMDARKDYAAVQAMADRVVAWAESMGVEELMEPRGASGQGKSAGELVLRFLDRAMAHRGRLGLDPLAYARLRKDLGLAHNQETMALERLAAAGGELTDRQAAFQAALGAPGEHDDPGDPDDPDDGEDGDREPEEGPDGAAGLG